MSEMEAKELIGIIQAAKPDAGDLPTSFLIGTIDPAYTSGAPKVRFDADDAPGIRTYPFLSGYTPVASDRVAVAVFPTSKLILGKITTTPPTPALVGYTERTQTIATGGTFAVGSTRLELMRFTEVGVVTGLIMPVGSMAAQSVILLNEGGSNATFAVLATSRVAEGAGVTVVTGACVHLLWDANTTAWYKVH